MNIQLFAPFIFFLCVATASYSMEKTSHDLSTPDYCAQPLPEELALSTEALMLRPFAPEDYTHIWPSLSETPDIFTWMLWCRMIPNNSVTGPLACGVASADMIRKKISGTILPFVFYEQKTKAFCGMVIFHTFSAALDAVCIGYWCRASQQRKGYTTQAVNTAVRYIFKNYPSLNTIFLDCDDQNSSSIHVALKLNAFLQEKKHGLVKVPGHEHEDRLSRRYRISRTTKLPNLEWRAD